MPKINNKSLNYYFILFISASVISLIVSILISPISIDQYIIFLILIIFISLVELFPIDLLHGKFSLVSIIAFSAGILYGIGNASLAYTLGIVAAVSIKFLFVPRFRRNSSSVKSGILEGTIHLGLIAIALLLSLLIFRIENGAGGARPYWMSILGAGLVYGLIHGTLYSILAKLSSGIKNNKSRWDYLALASIEILPLFWGFTTLLIIPILGNYSIVVLGVSVVILALLLHYLSAPRKDLERRILELSALDEVSKALRSEIDLEKLLGTIQVQVTGLLNVDNFYVALLDPADNNIWYPLAVKNGERKNWPRRQLTDRLTDRVILESKSILIPHHAGQQLKKIGLPSGEDAPYAWIGVPLITSEEVIGCLASFSLTSDVVFTEDDLNLLSILSGQTSVAIEIALHNALLASDITIGRDRLSTVLNSVQDGILLVENDGRITLINEAVQNLTGLPQSEFIGQKVKDLSPAAITSIGYSHLESGDLLADDFFVQEEALSKVSYSNEIQSTDRYIERTITPVISRSSASAGWIILLRDITDEQRVKEARELISETLVHDLRSPLSSTISALDVIQDSIANGDPSGVIEPSIQIAQRSSKRVLMMVESILEITKMETGSIELMLTEINIDQLLDDSIAEFSTVAMQYKVSVNKMIPQSLPLVRMDQEKIQRVLNNLIDNALKYSPENSQVTITAKLLAEEVLEIRISDSGPGVPQEYQQKIFERFVQVPGQASRKRGSGLGLTYCRLAVESHEGHLWMEDKPGGGSIFVFTLPLSGPVKDNPL